MPLFLFFNNCSLKKESNFSKSFFRHFLHFALPNYSLWQIEPEKPTFSLLRLYLACQLREKALIHISEAIFEKKLIANRVINFFFNLFSQAFFPTRKAEKGRERRGFLWWIRLSTSINQLFSSLLITLNQFVVGIISYLKANSRNHLTKAKREEIKMLFSQEKTFPSLMCAAICQAGGRDFRWQLASHHNDI